MGSIRRKVGPLTRRKGPLAGLEGKGGSWPSSMPLRARISPTLLTMLMPAMSSSDSTALVICCSASRLPEKTAYSLAAAS
jgi:hypothetical protein